MKAKTINVQITRCPRQYESIRIGGEWSVDKGETEAEVLDKALQMLNGYYDELMQPKQSPEQVAKSHKSGENSPEQVAKSHKSGENSPEQVAKSHKSGENSPEQVVKSHEKKKLSYDSQSDRDVLQAIINKMEREGVTLDTVLKYYEPDDTCLHCLQLVNAMNK